MAKRYTGRAPTHPGAILREDVMPALGMKKVKVAEALHVSRQALYDILNERKPVTPAMAVKLGKFCGNGARLWINMQAAHNLWHAQQSVDVSDIPVMEARV